MSNLKGKSELIISNLLVMMMTCGISASNAATPSSATATRGPQLPPSAALSAPQPTEVPSAPAVMTFQAWKGLRLEEARLVLERLTYEIQAERTAFVDRSPGEKQAVVKTAPEPALRTAAARISKSSSRSESRIDQAQMNLEIAQELTVNDYLQIYLSRFRSRDALLDVARRMGPDEVVDVLLAYQKLSTGSQIAEHSTSPAPRVAPRPL